MIPYNLAMVEVIPDNDPLPWLLEQANPSARYLTLRHVLGRPEGAPDVVEARAGILEADPAAGILAAQWPDGYWVTPDRGYTPRYRATVWQIMFLAQLGAPRDERIERACEFVWAYSRRDDGLFTPHKHPDLSELVTLNGSLLWALVQFGYVGDARTSRLLDALTGLDLESLLGAGDVDAIVKLSKALLAVPVELPAILEAFVDDAVRFLSGHLPLDPDHRYMALRFPLAEESDLVEMLLVLTRTDTVDDAQLESAFELLRSGQGQDGRWPLGDVPGKMWASCGDPGRVNKWVTVRALRVLRPRRI